MEEYIIHKCQTSIVDLELNKYPKELQEARYTVYRHINPVNGRVYVGITKLPLSFRWNKGNGYKRCKLFYRAIQKYGWDNLQHCVVCSNLDKKTACKLEQHLIKYYKLKGLSYNITDGGEGTVGFIMPQEAKEKIALFQKEIHEKPVQQYSMNGEFIREFKSAKEAAGILGYGHASVINCASGLRRENTLYGYLFVYKDQLNSLPQRLKWCEDHWRKYKIAQYKDGVLVNIFDSIHEAERLTGINHLCISRNIRGLQKMAGKYVWDRIKDES